MTDFLSERVVEKSRIERYCDVCLYIKSDFGFEDMINNVKLEEHEVRTIERMKLQGYKIPKGSSYIKSVFVHDGDFSQWNCDKEMLDIYNRYIASVNQG